MNIKIEGGGWGSYGNRGRWRGVRRYVEDEDVEGMKKGGEVEGFLNKCGE